MRKCKVCGVEKELEKFIKSEIWYRHICKECHAKKYRTGKPNLTRFKKGNIPWIKGKKINTKLLKKEKRTRKKGTCEAIRRAEWAKSIKERDGFRCISCASENDVHAHHIVPWKESEEKRYELSNGKTLCRSCHSREERLYESSIGKPGTRKRMICQQKPIASTQLQLGL